MEVHFWDRLHFKSVCDFQKHCGISMEDQQRTTHLQDFSWRKTTPYCAIMYFLAWAALAAAGAPKTSPDAIVPRCIGAPATSPLPIAIPASHPTTSSTSTMASTTMKVTGTPSDPQDYMTISLTNVHGAPMSLFFGSNVGVPSPIGDPQATALPHQSSTQYLFPNGWAGRIGVGPNLNPNGSKIEGSITGLPDIDVSFVDGFSVPITCSCDGVPVSGCNIDLFRQSNILCSDQVEGPVCLNHARNSPYGPAPPFFAPCAGAAYTFPKDDLANMASLPSNLVVCCIGTSCKAPLRQPGQQQSVNEYNGSYKQNCTCI